MTVADAVYRKIEALHILPLWTVGDTSSIEVVGDACENAQVTALEVTLRSEFGLQAIQDLSSRPELTIGAGTVLDRHQVDEVVDRGAQFIVCPGLDPSVVERALELGVAVLPGVSSATDLMRAQSLGLDRVKLFPAEPLGGVKMIAALSEPFPRIRFMPSGGVRPTNVRTYLNHPAVFAVSGSWMLAPELATNATLEPLTAALCKALEATR